MSRFDDPQFLDAVMTRLHIPEEGYLHTHTITTVVTVIIIPSLLPTLSLLRTVIDITEQNSSTISEVLSIYFPFVSDILIQR
jgi:hypothetical protein